MKYLLALLLILTACGGEENPWGYSIDPHDYDGPDHVVLGVWLEPHPLFQEDKVLEAFGWASVFGVEVFLTDQENADILVVDSKTTECDKAPAVSPFNTREISVDADCVQEHMKYLWFADGYFRLIMAHEFGHKLGMRHIPAKCDGSDPNPILPDLDGRPICGPNAVMNPVFNGNYHSSYEELDHRVFEVRIPDAHFPVR